MKIKEDLISSDSPTNTDKNNNFEKLFVVKGYSWGFIFQACSRFEINDDNIFSIIDFVIEKVKESGHDKIIFDEKNLLRKFSHFKIVEAVEYFQHLTSGLRITKIAFILNKNEDPSMSGFIENVGFNRGANFRFFYEMDEAVEWMNQ